MAGEKLDFEILHISQYLQRLISEKKIKLNKLDLKVTYHDPCDLGRSSGVYQEPREVIKNIPGIEFVELPNKNKQANCCGGGGNLESLNPDLAAKIAAAKADEVVSTGAQVVVSACQQCERTMSTALKKKKKEIDYKIKVMDISEIVLESMNA
jgi:heterodisulfide reductase subunit D